MRAQGVAIEVPKNASTLHRTGVMVQTKAKGDSYKVLQKKSILCIAQYIVIEFYIESILCIA